LKRNHYANPKQSVPKDSRAFLNFGNPCNSLEPFGTAVIVIYSVS
jgi:hypothetical protein